MVWIHGGGFTLGSKRMYSPSAAGLIKASQSNDKEGVIWVAMNYRLGAYVCLNLNHPSVRTLTPFQGFLSGPTFQEEGGIANAGLHDQRFALEWVQKHICRFGGNPNNVTIIGESAGGGSIMHQITAYGGLKPVPFQQAIVQSPGFQMVPSATAQENVFQSFLSRANVSTLQEARNLSSEALQLVNYQMVGEAYPYGTFTFSEQLLNSQEPLTDFQRSHRRRHLRTRSPRPTPPTRRLRQRP
jgi:cholinesterase